MARPASMRPPTTSPIVTAGLKWPPEMGPTAKAITRTERPTAKATATRPADGAEKRAAPHTAVTSVNVPMNSAPSSRGDDMNYPHEIRCSGGAGTNHMVHQVWVEGNGVGRPCALLSAVRIGGLVLEGVGMRHGNYVVAGIDEMDFARRSGGQIREQVERRAAKLIECDAAPKRRMPLLECEHRARIADAGARKGADRPGRNRIDANLVAAEIDREITN